MGMIPPGSLGYIFDKTTEAIDGVIEPDVCAALTLTTAGTVYELTGPENFPEFGPYSTLIPGNARLSETLFFSGLVGGACMTLYVVKKIGQSLFGTTNKICNVQMERFK